MGEHTTRLLTSRLGALASSAERSGADADAVARLLESAAAATMNAVALELLSDAAARPAVPAPAPAQPAPRPARLLDAA